ncbi:hypothetical protein ACHAW5_003360 [Stephanodiscus triporus]|uniref:Uncharacterized protein n=1 Tax=Stephanodiscus triporus TaxID=2934178 RepID=A0ABD3QUN6_9STRA
MNRHPKRMSRKCDDASRPSSSIGDRAGWEGGLSPAAYLKKTNARKSWNDSDSDDSLPLGSGRKGPRELNKFMEFSKDAIDRKSRKDGCGSSGDDSSSSSSSSSSVCGGEGGVGASHFEKGARTVPTARSNVTADPKTRESHTMHARTKAISRSLLSKISNAGKRERTTPHNAPGFSTAESKASRIEIPEDITSINQLQWYRMLLLNTDTRTMEVLQPCRVLSRGETVRCRKNNIINYASKMDGKNTVIQYLKFPDVERGLYKCVDDSSLIPFGHASKDGLSATFNDDYLRRYLQQQSKTVAPRDLESMRLFIKRAFDHARETERKSRVQAKKDLQEYYDSSSGDEADIGHSGKQVSESKRVQFEVLENDDVVSGDDGENHYEIDDLEIPYTQAITYDPDDFGTVEGQSNEPIRPGDVIECYCPIFVTGDPRGLRQATVLAVDPNDAMPLVLSNGEGLFSSTSVKRIKVMSGNELVDHPGIFRAMDRFKLTKSGNATAADAISMEAARFGAIMKKNISRLKEKAEADGFAPMDLLVNIKGVKIRPKNPTHTNASTSTSFRRKERESLPSSSSDDISNSETAKITSKEAMKEPVIEEISDAIFCTGKTNGNKENNQAATGEEKKSRGGCFSSPASLGSSLATSDASSIESISICLGVNHQKMTQGEKSSPPKMRQLKTNSQSDANTYDLSLSSDDDEAKRRNVRQKRMGKSKSVRPCLSNKCFSSEISLEITNPFGLTRKMTVKPSPTISYASPKRQLKRVPASVNRSTLTASNMNNGNDKRGSASKNSLENEQDLSSPPPASTSSFLRSNSSIRKKAGTTSSSRFTKLSSSSDMIEISRSNRSNPTTKKRQLPSSDSSSSDDGDDAAISKPHRMRNESKVVRMQDASGQSRDSSESIERLCKSKERMESVNLESVKKLGWTRGKAGWEKSSASGFGFRFGRYK